MLKHRVIPALLLHNGGLVKTTRFRNPKYVGDPINAIRIFNEKEVDELMVLDINASKKDLEPSYSLIEQFAGECFMPLTYGGGIRNVEQARFIFSLGVEKICLQSAALESLRFVRELVDCFGSQSIIVSVDVKYNWLRCPKLYQSATGRFLKVSWLKKIHEFVAAGAGEILLNAVDKDGTLQGPDLFLIEQASNQIDVPLIALGGVSNLNDIKACIESGASAVAAGSYFVFHGPHRGVLITYPRYDELKNLFEM
jgi:cyclase